MMRISESFQLSDFFGRNAAAKEVRQVSAEATSAFEMVPVLRHRATFWRDPSGAMRHLPSRGEADVMKAGGHKTRPYNWFLIDNT